MRAAGLPLTLNVVVHRQNLDGVPDMIEMALALGARRLEIAHVQYYGWALANRAALLPSRRQLDEATAVVEAARERLKGVLDHRLCRAGLSWRAAEILHGRLGPPVPQRHAVRHGGALPCGRNAAGHRLPLGAHQQPGRHLVRSDAFNRFRGTDWMAEPCRSCDRREIDWGGCRCQAFLLAGDAGRADPVCALSPDHGVVEAALQEAEGAPPAFVYRRYRAVSISPAPSDEPSWQPPG